jgi:flagellar motor component MotA
MACCDQKAETGLLPPGQKTNRINAMTQMEIDTLEHASRAVMAWSPEGYDGRIHLGAMLGAILPAIGILAAAAAFLFVAF